MPELATSVVASLRGERDIAVGNAIGSCLFNVLAVLGVAAVVAPDGIAVAPAVLRFDLPIMIIVAVACLPVFFTGHEIARWEGAVFLGYYVAYVLYLILAAADHAAVGVLSATMLWFAVPLTVLTLGVTTARALRRRYAA
jgi:cation:H+ antiporter